MIGAYILILHLKKDCKIRIGKLGVKKFKEGYYAYIGSAFGKFINIEQRVNRHLKLAQTKKQSHRWHVDYLLSNENVLLINSLKLQANRRIECTLADAVRQVSDNFIPNFGSTDCNCCPSHLYYFHSNPSDLLEKLVGRQFKK